MRRWVVIQTFADEDREVDRGFFRRPLARWARKMESIYFTYRVERRG